MRKYFSYHHYFHCKTYFFVFKVIVCMMCVCVCDGVWVGVCMGTCEIRWAQTGPLDNPLCRCRPRWWERHTQPSHSEGIAPPSQLHSCPADVSFFFQNFYPPLMESESPTKYSKPIAKQNISDQLGFNVKINHSFI